MRLSIKGVRIAAMQVVVGARKIDLLDGLDEFYDGDMAKLNRLKKATGLSVRHIVEGEETGLDMAEYAVRKLFSSLESDFDTIDWIVYVTQTPDHFQPNNASILHGRLGLSKSVGACDMNSGCSGWVYGLSYAASLIQSGVNRVLLVAGDTLSRHINTRDRASAPLFGDGVSVTLLDRDESAKEMSFSMFTDGSRWQSISIPAGGMRIPLNEASLLEHEDEDGNWRSLADLHVKGADVFQFSITEVPKALKTFLADMNIDMEDVGPFFFHQANAYIISNIARRLKLPMEKVPMRALSRYGNLSSASIPSVICDILSEDEGRLAGRHIVAGYGVGLSWAIGLIDLSNTCCLPVLVYNL